MASVWVDTLATRHQRDFYLANSSSLSETLPLYQVEYSLIEELVLDGLDLFSSKRLPRLERVVVNGQVKDELAFGRWLSGSDTLKEIIFKCDFSQEFYSTILPASCPTLQCITLYAPSDHSFLLKFLIKIGLNRLAYGLTELLFSNLAYLRRLRIGDQDHLRSAQYSGE